MFLTTIGVPSGPIVLAIELPLASVSYQTSPFLCSLLSDLPDFKVSLDLADIASAASFNSSAVELNEEAALDIDKVALDKIKTVDETSELTEADMLEDGTLIVYNN